MARRTPCRQRVSARTCSTRSARLLAARIELPTWLTAGGPPDIDAAVAAISDRPDIARRASRSDHRQNIASRKI